MDLDMTMLTGCAAAAGSELGDFLGALLVAPRELLLLLGGEQTRTLVRRF